mgnify:CR=1 FL=1
MEPIIRLENIHQVFDDVTVLDDITLDIYPGEIVSIIGPSGSGKTTIFNLITKSYDVNSGKLLFDGIDINELDEEFKTNIIPYFLNDIPQDVIAEISNEISHHSKID